MKKIKVTQKNCLELIMSSLFGKDWKYAEGWSGERLNEAIKDGITFEKHYTSGLWNSHYAGIQIYFRNINYKKVHRIVRTEHIQSNDGSDFYQIDVDAVKKKFEELQPLYKEDAILQKAKQNRDAELEVIDKRVDKLIEKSSLNADDVVYSPWRKTLDLRFTNVDEEKVKKILELFPK